MVFTGLSHTHYDVLACTNPRHPKAVYENTPGPSHDLVRLIVNLVSRRILVSNLSSTRGSSFHLAIQRNNIQGYLFWPDISILQPYRSSFAHPIILASRVSLSKVLFSYSESSSLSAALLLYWFKNAISFHNVFFCVVLRPPSAIDHQTISLVDISQSYQVDDWHFRLRAPPPSTSSRQEANLYENLPSPPVPRQSCLPTPGSRPFEEDTTSTN